MRINYDHTLTPDRDSPRRRWAISATTIPTARRRTSWITILSAELGLEGGFGIGFPRFTRAEFVTGWHGAGLRSHESHLYLQDKPIAVANVTVVRGNHSYKFGGEWKFENFTNRSTAGVAGTYNFAAAQTGFPPCRELRCRAATSASRMRASSWAR